MLLKYFKEKNHLFFLLAYEEKLDNNNNNNHNNILGGSFKLHHFCQFENVFHAFKKLSLKMGKKRGGKKFSSSFSSCDGLRREKKKSIVGY